METLVLSQRYQPVARITWQRAMSLLFHGKVEVVEEYEDRQVRSVTLVFNVPAVVRFLRWVRSARKAIRFSRENVYARDRGRCQYCGQGVARCDFTYDHVIPRSQGGPTRWENVVVCCTPCNQRKGGRTPAQARMKLLGQPVRPGSLPSTTRLSIQWRGDMPAPWRQWLQSVAYWSAPLEED